jgi:hypothetical protein
VCQSFLVSAACAAKLLVLYGTEVPAEPAPGLSARTYSK